MTCINDYVYWNSNSYGNAILIKKSWLKTIFIIFCIITPFTNWMIPLVNKIIKTNIWWRY